LNKVIRSIAVIILLWIFQRIVSRLAYKKSKDIRVSYNLRKVSAYITFVLGLIIVGRIWFEGVQSIATFLGLVSAGLAIALKDLVADIAAWIFIIWRRPFGVGDRIHIGEHSGDVIDIRPFQFSIMEIGKWVDAEQSTGRVIHVSNGQVFTESLINYSQGFQFIWEEIPILITFESNWEKAKSILFNIVNKHAEQLGKGAEKQIKEASKKYMIFYNILTPIVYTSVKDSGVMLTMRYLVQPQKRRGTSQTIWEDILKEFAECTDIDFAYPTQRIYYNLKEGKEGTKPIFE